jgi:hypothetical protein
MVSLLRRLFGRGAGAEPKSEPLKCYICGVDTGYRCSVCGRYMCNLHTDPGTTECVECAAEERQERMR